MNSKLLKYFSIVAFVGFLISGCSDFLTNTSNTGATGNGKIKITIQSPLSNDSVGYGSTKVNYTIVQDLGVNFLELYVDGKINKYIAFDASGAVPTINLNIDSSKIGSKFSYFVIYYDKDGYSVRSDTMTNLVVVEPKLPPYAPYNLILSRLTKTSVNIAWKDSSKGVTGFEIWRKIGSSGNFARYLSSGPKTFNINDTNLNPDSTYYYKIRSINKYGESDFSEVKSTTGSSNSNVDAPYNVKAIATGTNVVKLTWSANNTNVNFFRVERKYSFSDYSSVGIVDANTFNYTDSLNGLTAGGEYYYRIKAYSGSDSAASSEVYVKTLSYVLSKPNITSITSTEKGMVKIDWVINDYRTANIVIERKLGVGGSFTQVVNLDSNIRTYSDSSLVSGATYYYRMKRDDGSISSEYSSESGVVVK